MKGGKMTERKIINIIVLLHFSANMFFKFT